MTMLIPLDPWTVHGEPIAGDDRDVWEVDVPDIGVLPPPGTYLGTATSTDHDRSVVRITVPARPESGDLAPRHRIRLEIVGRPGASITSPMTLVFEAVEH